MFILFLVWALVALAIGFVIFVLALMGGVVGLWGVWLAVRTRRGAISAGGKDEIITLLGFLLLFVLCSPVLFVALLLML